MIGLIIIMISLFTRVKNYFDSTTMSQAQIIMNISLQYYNNNVYFIDVGPEQLSIIVGFCKINTLS